MNYTIAKQLRNTIRITTDFERLLRLDHKPSLTYRSNVPLFTSESAKQARVLRKHYPSYPKPEREPKRDDYVYRTLLRTRRQIKRLFEMIEAETDPVKIDRLAAAIERLSKQEQNLAGRPGPGQLRPMPEKPAKRQSQAEPIEPQ